MRLTLESLLSLLRLLGSILRRLLLVILKRRSPETEIFLLLLGLFYLLSIKLLLSLLHLCIIVKILLRSWIILVLLAAIKLLKLSSILRGLIGLVLSILLGRGIELVLLRGSIKLVLLRGSIKLLVLLRRRGIELGWLAELVLGGLLKLILILIVRIIRSIVSIKVSVLLRIVLLCRLSHIDNWRVIRIKESLVISYVSRNDIIHKTLIRTLLLLISIFSNLPQ